MARLLHFASAVNRLAVHLTALERMKGPHDDVYGPWPEPVGPGL